MNIDDKITIHNYKCFGEEGGGFDKICPINVIIGKNNSGKSSLLDLIKFLVEKNPVLDYNSSVLMTSKLSQTALEKVYPTFNGNLHQRELNKIKHQKLLNIDITYSLKTIEYTKVHPSAVSRYGFSKDYISMGTDEDTEKSIDISYKKEFIKEYSVPLQGKIFCHITAERNVEPEVGNIESILAYNGSGATNYIQYIINSRHANSSLIETKLLNAINEITKPEIKFRRILVQTDKNNIWEIFFDDQNDNRIPLSKMGSGIKTIILVLLNLIVRPEIENKQISEYVFAFEELENNLHPALQRKLYKFIRDYSEKNSCYFFITTHSNVVIDIFGKYDKAQIIHVIHNGNTAVTETLCDNEKFKKLLDDLEVKASDILQSNGIIWVEGPSDRTYINKWLTLMAPYLEEGLHYSIMFYGGRLLSHLEFNKEWVNKNLIPLLKINSNAFVLIDKDARKATDRVNNTKNRIEEEIGEGNCWITAGREIENYLESEIIKHWLKKLHNIDLPNFYNEKFTSIDENIASVDENINFKYSSNKAKYSGEIINYINRKTIKFEHDLEEKMNLLIAAIRRWNSLDNSHTISFFKSPFKDI